MVAYRVVVGSVLMSVFAWTGQASAGWVIEQVVKGGGGDRQQVMLQANRMKTLVFEGGKPASAGIVDLNAQTVTQVDYRERYYVTTSVREFVQMMQGAMAGATKEMQEAMKQMQEEMKDMSPEERKMAQQMMGQMMPGQTPQACREPRMELKKTGQQATIAGYPAVRYDVLADGKLESEVWIAKGLTAWRELDQQKIERFGAEMAKLAACGPGPGRQGFAGADPHWKLAGEGYPVRTVDSGSGVTVEVVKAESRSIPAAEFQPPAGFARKTLQEMMRR